MNEARSTWTRFQYGDLACTVVSDGRISTGPAASSFPDADPDELAALLAEHRIPPDRVQLDVNLLLVDTGDELVMFDSGTGAVPDLGRERFGDGSGKGIDRLCQTGIAPEDITLVALTHAHPDHAWGLVDDDGNKLYPNARVVLHEDEYNYWTDPREAESAANQSAAERFRGVEANIAPYRDSLLLLQGDTATVCEGIGAVATPGHSPGHVVYHVRSGDRHLVCLGDLCHHEVLLLQRPDWHFVHDWDADAARAQRMRVLGEASEQRLDVFGYHFAFPGIGRLVSHDPGYGWSTGIGD